MAAVALTGSGAAAVTGRAGLTRAVALTGRGDIASGGRAFARLTIPLTGRGAITTGGTINTGLVSTLSAHATTIANRLAAGSTTELTNSRERQWREELSEAGFGQFTLMQDNGLTSSVDWLPNQLVDFHIGSRLAYTILVEQYEAVDIDERAEEAAQLTKYKGRGHISLLDRIVVYPALGPYKRPIEEDRSFNYVDRAYDDTVSPWRAATEIMSVLFAQGSSWAGGAVQWDIDFPDVTALILWAHDGTSTSAAVGDCYFRQSVTIPTTGDYQIAALMDNFGEIHVDGVLVLSPGQTENTEVGFESTSKTTLELTAGDHLVAAKGTNANTGAINPAGIAWCIHPIDAVGTLGSLTAHSDSTSRVNEYATEPPGMTPGQAIIICLDEALAREADPLWQAIRDNLNFDEARDSNGDFWPTFADMATKVGTGLFTFLRELAGTYIDFSMTPGSFALNAWTIGGRSSGGSASFHSPTNPADQTTGNLLRLKRTGAA